MTLGIVLGCFSATHRGSWLDLGHRCALGQRDRGTVVRGRALLAARLRGSARWLPAIGAGEAGDLGDQLRHLVLPAFAIGLGWVGYIARLVRASMLEVMGENYIRTARAFGLPERRIVYRYALTVAILPTVALLGVGIGNLLSGAVFAEIVFARPGVGKLIYDSVLNRNYPVVMGAVLVTTTLYVLATLIADLLAALLDPRVRANFWSRHPPPLRHRQSVFADALARVLRDPLGALGATLVVLFALSAALAPMARAYDPNALDLPARLQGPSLAHLLGTDNLGRDVFSRVLYGGRIALGVALTAATYR